jgi:hypothetical protein
MSGFVTFESLEEGAYFFARDKWHMKETYTLFGKAPDLPARASNALCVVCRESVWTHFDPVALVQLYETQKHGTPADVIQLQELPPA